MGSSRRKYLSLREVDRWRGWAHTVEGSKVKRRRSLSLGELKGRMLQAGKRSEKAKVSEEAVRRKGGGGGPMEWRMG